MIAVAGGTRELMLRFNGVAWVRPDAVRALLSALGADGLFDRAAREWAEAAGIAPESAERLKREAEAFDWDRELELAGRLGARLLFDDDPEYPGLLKSVADAPLALYVRGRLSERPGLALVGSRHPTAYGRRMARVLAAEAAQAGYVVVSGLARGIDTESHRAAMAAGGLTWAVLGSGLDAVYPPENDSLAEEIVSRGGCLLSEFPFSTAALPGHFPRRNRIVSGLSWGTVVVEGELRSGSLITARLAAEQGREVFGVPGPADSRLSAAPHRVLRQGGKLAATLADIEEELPPGARPGLALDRPAREPAAVPPLSIEQKKILEWLGPDSRTLDELGAQTGLALPQLANELFELELQGQIEPLPGQRYAKRASEGRRQ